MRGAKSEANSIRMASRGERLTEEAAFKAVVDGAW